MADYTEGANHNPQVIPHSLNRIRPILEKLLGDQASLLSDSERELILVSLTYYLLKTSR